MISITTESSTPAKLATFIKSSYEALQAGAPAPAFFLVGRGLNSVFPPYI